MPTKPAQPSAPAAPPPPADEPDPPAEGADAPADEKAPVVMPVPAPESLAALFTGFADDEPDSAPPTRRTRKTDDEMFFYDGVVRTAPRNKLRKLYLANQDAAKSAAHRIGRAITRAKLGDVFESSSARERPDHPNHANEWYAFLRPKTAANATTPAAPATDTTTAAS